MISLLKNVLKPIRSRVSKFIRKEFINYVHAEPTILDLKSASKVYPKSFGDKNPDKKFYVIWRDGGGAGFFSNFTHVMIHIKIAEDLDMIPVVDFKNFRTFYNEDHGVNGNYNAWEYYFKRLSPYTLDEVYSSKNVFFCDGEFSWSIWNKYFKSTDLFKSFFNKYIHLDNVAKERISRYSEIFNQRILGVHFRGKEMNYAPDHPFGATLNQMFTYTDMILEKYNLSKIFIVTEEKRYLDAFVSKYKNKVMFTDSFCIEKMNAYNIYPRESHKYLLGLEVLCDAVLLSKCNILLCNESNVSGFANFIGNHETVYLIDNGKNVSNRLVARYLYFFKKILPSKLGGLKNNLIIKKY